MAQAQRKNIVLALLAIVGGLAACAGSWLANLDDKPSISGDIIPVVLPSPEHLPQKVNRKGFVSSDACIKCHRDQHKTWHDSYHRSMTQVASPDAIRADFANVRLEAKQRTYQLSREDDNFFVEMADPDWEATARMHGMKLEEIADPPRVRLPVVMATGSHHMQGYWVPSEIGNQLRQIPWFYLIAEELWIPREDAFLQPPSTFRHFATWNDNCIVCHSVAGAPRLDAATETVATEVAEFGIACEACHGPGQEHVNFQKRRALGESLADLSDTIINPAKCDARISSQICGQCHNFFKPRNPQGFSADGYTSRAGDDLSETRLIWTHERTKDHPQSTDLVRGCYWDDGTCRVGGREFLGMIESKCFASGKLACVSCHSMHGYTEPNDQMGENMHGDQACFQCHQDYAKDIPGHTHHAADSVGSRCYNCHMPHTSYALFKGIRSHRIDSPNAATSAETGRPNACNLCHQEETLQWTSEKLKEWYGHPETKLTTEQQQTSAMLTWLLSGDAVQRVISAWHMGWEPALQASGKEWQTRFLAELLEDDYATNRFVAFRSLRNHPGLGDIKYDFTAPVADREKLKQRVIDLWQSRLDQLSEKLNSTVLLGEQRKLDLQRMQQLIDKRNNRAIFLPE
ncbi:MAG: hypothetical protein CMJ78_16260 [Planctomycetaceae bacterium]|nr:hypothetical protein [Planctomycetaceae bacterium]